MKKKTILNILLSNSPKKAEWLDKVLALLQTHIEVTKENGYHILLFYFRL